MDSEKFYFQIDYKGVKRTSSSEFGEGCSQGTIFVEVAADAFANSVDDAAIDSAVEEGVDDCSASGPAKSSRARK